MRRPAVVVWLPADEFGYVAEALGDGGFEAVRIDGVDDLERILASRKDIGAAIIDGDAEGVSIFARDLLHPPTRTVPTLIVVSPGALDRVLTDSPAASGDEFMTRPYTAESLRWRVEAMLIRAQTVDDGSGAVIQGGPVDSGAWSRRASVIAVFNPKGGVGKTSVATNLAATLAQRDQQVLLIDADIVTGHVTTSLGLEQGRTVADSWSEEAADGVAEEFLAIGATHPTGMHVLSLTSSPLHTEVLEPERVGEAIKAARRSFDFIIVDTHPSYGPLNLAIFDQADRIILPVTPDMPAIRAAVQLRDVATELGIVDRLALVINRVNTGVSVEDLERTVGLASVGRVRSAGLLFVRAGNEGRTVVERFPKDKVTSDFEALADYFQPAKRRTTITARPALRTMFRRSEAIGA